MMTLMVTYVDGSTESFSVDAECWEHLDDERITGTWIRLFGDDLAVLVRVDQIRHISIP